jgi:hypothetical protein
MRESRATAARVLAAASTGYRARPPRSRRLGGTRAGGRVPQPSRLHGGLEPHQWLERRADLRERPRVGPAARRRVGAGAPDGGSDWESCAITPSFGRWRPGSRRRNEGASGSRRSTKTPNLGHRSLALIIAICPKRFLNLSESTVLYAPRQIIFNRCAG